ncbi:neprilysin-2-like [Microplitis mediator]|uniref:neprilysin-2-like n=1 Tax=Microplitis mediator TaxID=375433 RepID=UPI002554E6DB|nr:neprilysin-2-like [Microplitis mediator]
MGDYYRIPKKLFIIASIGIIFSFFLTNTSAAVIKNIRSNEITKNCSDPNCGKFYSELTKQINVTLDKNVNPCDNIQQFVCGHSELQSFSEKWDEHEDIVHKHLEMLIPRVDEFVDFKPFKLLTDFYKTCMSYENTGQQSLDLLSDIIKKLGNWPLLEGDSWKESDFDWIDFSIKSQNIGFKSLNFLDVMKFKKDDKSTMDFLLPIIPGGLTDQHSTLNTSIAAYKNYIAKVSKLLGNTQSSSEEIDEIIAFERNLSKFYDATREFKGLPFDEFNKIYPSTNWKKLLNNIRVYNNEVPTNLSNSMIFKTSDFSDFVELMEKTPKRVQANYGVWKIIQKTIPYLTDEYRKLKSEYCTIQKCEIEMRAKSCDRIIRQYLSSATSLLYAKNFYNNDIDTIATEMVVNIKEQFVNLINESTWMNKETKNQEIELLKNTTFVIGYGEKKNTDDEFVKYYENLEIDTTNYFRTLLNLELFYRKSNVNQSLGENRSFEYLSSHSNNRGLEIFVPMSMLQEPFFSVNYPMYVNYGYTGKAIADKIAESIVVKGEKITGGKDLDRINKEKTLCFRQQMENYTSNNVEKPLDVLFRPYKQISEHIAYEATYRAYQQWITKHRIEPSLPELPFSNNQMFWINSIRNFCISSPKESIVIDNKYSVFDFYKMRAVTSVPEFYKDFNCPIDHSFVKNYGPSCTFFEA